MPVHTKDDNYKDNDEDIVQKIFLNIKEQKNPHYSYNDKGTENQYHWNHFQNYFFSSWWTIKTFTPNQNPSSYNELENLKWQMSVRLE